MKQPGSNQTRCNEEVRKMVNAEIAITQNNYVSANPAMSDVVVDSLNILLEDLNTISNQSALMRLNHIIETRKSIMSEVK